VLLTAQNNTAKIKEIVKSFDPIKRLEVKSLLHNKRDQAVKEALDKDREAFFRQQLKSPSP